MRNQESIYVIDIGPTSRGIVDILDFDKVEQYFKSNEQTPATLLKEQLWK